MKLSLRAFRICNFRSIIDSSWCNFSPDNITGIIGQNESGKTSVLEALYAYYTGKLDEDFVRSDGHGYPVLVDCSFSVSDELINELINKYSIPEKVYEIITKEKRINIRRIWKENNTKIITEFLLEEESLKNAFDIISEEYEKYQQLIVVQKQLITKIEALKDEINKITDASTIAGTPLSPDDQLKINENSEHIRSSELEIQNSKKAVQGMEDKLQNLTFHKISNEELTNQQKIYTEQEFIKIISSYIPEFIYFEDNGSLLPKSIDVDDLLNNNDKVNGYKGAMNFITVSGIDLKEIISANERMVENRIDEFNRNITTEFRKFWKQKVGKNDQIKIEFTLRNYPLGNDKKVGKPFFTFWISDNKTKLYPDQRSKGVRWFLSFFLQLKASYLHNEGSGHIFLIDEPGGSLHAKAQENVLDLLEEIKGKIQIIYTTHSPYLINLDKIYRLLAAQRNNSDIESSETQIICAHELGSASEDTLTPLYSLMGIRLSDTSPISKTNNIILEEISAYYYLHSFMKLLGENKQMYFLPATGVTQVSNLANLLLGWGIDYGIVLDDDSEGRRTYKEILNSIFMNDSSLAEKRMITIQDCKGIEDIFSTSDFKKYIIGDTKIDLGTKRNSEYMNNKSISKGITAYKYFMKVEGGKLNLADFTNETQKRIERLIKKVILLTENIVFQ